MAGTDTLFEGNLMEAYRPPLQTDGAGSDDGADLPRVSVGDGDESFFSRDEADQTLAEIAAAEAAVNRTRAISERFRNLTGVKLLHEVVEPEPLRTHPLHVTPQILGVEGDYRFN